tara:strand:- start:253 stop:969 length:717 start_codon:yes stop_codon:yes gene_type:complete
MEVVFMNQFKLEIISSSSCPFAQRTRMALIEKGIEFSLNEIDLDNKPDWFLKLSPYGKVPVIRNGDYVVFESSIINEYIEEIFPQKPLLPQNPEDRAAARVWIDFANVRFAPQIYKILLAQSEHLQGEHARRLNDALLMMEHQGLAKRSSGPYWLGEKLSLVDLTFYPHLQRFCALQHYRNFDIPDECGALREWLTKMEESYCVQVTKMSEDKLIKSWAKYAFNTSTGTTADDMREVD